MTHPYTITRRGRDSTWFALVMNAASAIENASYCLRDADAKLSADGAAKHYRDAANAMFSASDKPERVLTETEGMRIVVAAGLKGGHVITTNTAAHIARAVEAAILAKLA